MFFAGKEIMSPKKWFKGIIKLKKTKEDKSKQEKVISFLSLYNLCNSISLNIYHDNLERFSASCL